MSPPLFWVDHVPDIGDDVRLDGDEGRHAVTVTRVVVGERIILGDGAGRSGLCEVIATEGKSALRARVLETVTTGSPEPTVTVVQALPKSERSELAVDLATEAGVDAIVPWQSARCVARWVGPKADKGVAKWRSAAAAAAKQSRRAHIPAIAPLARTSDVRTMASDVVLRGGVVAVLHESATTSLRSLDLAVPEIMLVVGPEGGLDDSEIDDLTAVGAVAVLLGPEVLRTSSAAAVALGAIGAMTSRWEVRPRW
ncbi:16S rRNA (uracil(1498)-N(3))-methyltransferase [Williamsia sp.]|uniref:16S rRNA (uracil(1498)-N(3))-methyltransferase n=1 Tax=Williamsia sp. TaxID=1872085 RepID=UPI002F91EE42